MRLLIQRFLLLCILTVVSTFMSQAQNQALNSDIIAFSKEKGTITLVADGKALPIVISAKEYPGVIRITKLFQDDIAKVTSVKPELSIGELPKSESVIIAGTLGKSELIDQLVASGKLNVSDLKGKWETSLIQVVENPFPGIKHALVIAGSDKRGTIFGMFDLSRQMGISPWNFWADVPAKKHPELYIRAGRYLSGEPKVKYRGIFLNDEEPALGRWAVKNYGGFNHQFYEKVFELILRLKGNYLWPAMWWASFNTDDPVNPELAEEMGIVMSTTHHEPMMRAHAEWKKKRGAAWNYETNKDSLQKFWKEGIDRMKNHESIVSMGMRGDGDMAMTAETNIALLERIVADQRKIIENVTGKPASETPQLWALYKEVQDYYDNGMRVPDDVTLLLCDDNWGNIRKLPRPDDKPRAGGYGIYYHFDYVGGPRNYKWLNTCPLPAVWEQMNMAYTHGVDRIWLVNVGDLKPVELPISFFLDYAWNPDQWPKERLPEYTRNWAAEQFGSEHAPEIARMLDLYTKYNGRRKPELLSPETYSLTNFQEFERVVEEYNQLAREAEALNEKIPSAQKDAFYQLLLHPITACANLNELYLTVAKNRQAAAQGRAIANDWAEKARQLYQKDADITDYYHTKLANGKWNLMMAQTHIGYTYWQQPEKNSMPEVKEISLPDNAEMGVSIEGSGEFSTEGMFPMSLPEMDILSKQSGYIDLFNRGKQSFDYQISTDQTWLKTEPATGKIDKEQRVWLSADWSKVPEGKHEVLLKIRQSGREILVKVPVFKPNPAELKGFKGFVESNGFVSIEAEHFSRNIPANNMKWEVIPGLGRTFSGMKVFPVTAKSQVPGKSSPCLEYDVYFFQGGKVDINLYLSPTLNYFNDGGTELAVSFDNDTPIILNMNKDNQLKTWESWVSNNINQVVSTHRLDNPGKHTLKIWMVDPGVVLQRVIIDCGGLKSTYLGSLESTKIK
ncbi:MAG: glycosyl hydrolase 115 family protein [Prolixibacteraceae bacterium]|nr:glycosyl hydrolase 115 family protein [Prolixibacteraceae bacterium]